MYICNVTVYRSIIDQPPVNSRSNLQRARAITMFSIFHLFLLVNFVICSSKNDPLLTRMDRLLAYRRFTEAKILLEAAGDYEYFCTPQILARCIDLRNYKAVERDYNLARQLRMTDSFMVALEDGSVTSDPKQIVKEADDLLVILIPHAVTNSRTITRALNTAVFHKDFELMERLLAYGWDRFSEDENGLTPLMMAIRYHRGRTLRWLLQAGANIHYVNRDGNNLVHIWAQTDFSDCFVNSIIEVLIEKVPTLNWKALNKAGRTPLDIAINLRNRAVINILEKFENNHK